MAALSRSRRAGDAALSRSRRAGDAELIAAHQAFKAGYLAEQVRRAVNEPPALTGEQCAEIATILAEAEEQARRARIAG